MVSSLAEKKEQLSKIKNGKGLQHILNEVNRIMGNPLLVHDMEYTLMEYSKVNECDDRIWMEFLTCGRLREETIEFFKNESFIDNVANATDYGGVTFLTSSKLRYNRIFGQLYNNEGIPVADACMVASELPFDESTPELFKLACGVLSKELSKNDYYKVYGQKHQERIIKELIDGCVEDKGIYTGYVANLDKDLKSHIFVTVVDISQSAIKIEEPEYFVNLLKALRPDFKYYVYTNYIVMLISLDTRIIQPKKHLPKLYKFFEEKNLFAGVSDSFENLFDLQQHYIEALLALKIGMKNNAKERFFVYVSSL